MRKSSLAVPISVLISGVMVVAMLLATNGGTTAAPNLQMTTYPAPTQTAFAVASLTAQAQQNSNPYPGQTQTSQTTPGTTSTGQTTTPSTSTTAGPTSSSLFTPTATTTPTTEAVTAAPIPTTELATAQVMPTETPQPTPDPNNLACAPGTVVNITGEGPPNIGYMLYFGKRIVSGGTVRRDGTFSIDLEVGAEAAGSYPVEVRVRGSRELLASRVCNVPYTTPTPLPRSKTP